MHLKLVATAFFCMLIACAYSQEKSPAKFGKLSLADFEHKTYAIDTSADAVVIADIGNTEIIGNFNGGFSLEYERYKRVHVLNKNGYDEADVEIELYVESSILREEIQSLKAVTYNVENGKIVETRLDLKAAVFEDKLDKNHVVKKFTMPNIKEGSIIEYQYKIKSDFIFNLQPWLFQGNHPVLWSEYNVSIPEFYYYVKMMQGYQRFYLTDEKTRQVNFNVTIDGGASANERVSLSAQVTDNRYVMKNVPALKEESFTSTLRNHISRIDFQLSRRQYPLSPKSFMGNWTDLTHSLLEIEEFGLQLNKDNGWLSDIVKEVTQKSTTDVEKAYAIFRYVRDNFTCTNHNSIYMSSSLKTVLKNRNGNEAEVNLLLTAMLKKADLFAEPVILSTRNHGYAVEMYPLLYKFNYVVCRVNLAGNNVYLDASEPLLGFGRLGYYCYNGMGRVINQDASYVSLNADSLKESSVTSLMMYSDDKGHLTGNVQQSVGYAESYALRKMYHEKGKDQVINEIKKEAGTDFEIKDFVIDSLKRYEDPITIRYEVDLKNEGEDIIYFNPMLSEAIKENPFKSAERFYPVEMPFTTDETYVMRLEVPAGYVVDEMPKSIKMKMNEEGDGYFEYLIGMQDNVISLRSRITIKRALYMPEEYEMLREFYNQISQKHSEQIVFKKK